MKGNFIRIKALVLRYLLVLTLLWGLVGQIFAASNPDFSKLLNTLGVVSDKREFASFDYIDLKSGQRKSLDQYLNEHKKPLTMLVFWATWCGPCRYELPQLNELYNKFQSKFNLIAISLDNEGDQKSVKKFVEENKFNFDVGLDQQNSAAQLYNAVSIPLIYLIDGNRRLIGKIQGARDWKSTEVYNDFATLFDIGKLSNDALAKVKSDNSVKELPAPVISLNLSETTLTMGQEFFITIKISWKGSAYLYRIKPPTLTLPDGVVELGMGASADDESDGASFSYKVKLKAKREGSYQLSPVLLSFGTSSEGKELFSRKEIPPFTIKSNSSLLMILAIAVTLILGLTFILPLLAKRRNSLGQNVQSDEELFKIKLLEVMAEKVHLSNREYSLQLLGLMMKVYGNRDESRSYQFAKIVDEIKFASKELSREELASFEVEIKNQIEKRLKEKGE